MLINSIMQPNTDAQCVAFKDAFFSSKELQEQLREMDHHATAIMPYLVGCADMAWDAQGAAGAPAVLQAHAADNPGTHSSKPGTDEQGARARRAA
jgi:hypothetical protein